MSVRDKFTSSLSDEADIIGGTFLVIVGIVAVIGNGLSVALFWNRRSKLAPAELLLMNMSVTSLLLAGLSYPAAMVSFFKHRWIFGDIGCSMYGFTCFFLGLVNMTSILALAVVRYLKTCCYKTIGSRIHREHVVRIIGIMVVFVFLWACIPFIGISSFDVEPFGTSCTLEWNNPTKSGKIYILVTMVSFVAIPIVLMSISYTCLLYTVHKNIKKMSKKTNRQESAPSESQLTMISLAVCMGFVAAWVPYAVVSVYYGVIGNEKAPPYVSVIPVLLAKSSCAYNPFFYVFVTRRYRVELLNMFPFLAVFGCKAPSVHTTDPSSDTSINMRGHQNSDGFSSQVEVLHLTDQTKSTLNTIIYSITTTPNKTEIRNESTL